jgi:hypothetical protein
MAVEESGAWRRRSGGGKLSPFGNGGEKWGERGSRREVGGGVFNCGRRKSVFIEEKRMVFMADYCRDYV